MQVKITSNIPENAIGSADIAKLCIYITGLMTDFKQVS